MERHGDHGTDLVQIHLYETVIVGYLTGVQFLIFFGPSVDLVELTDLVVGLPDRGQTGGLCSHDINTDTEISTQGSHAGTYEFHNFIFHITVFEYGTDDRQCHVLRTDTLHGSTL